mgnify:CR=1 FL=1
MQKEILELYKLVQNKNIEKAYSISKKLYQNNKNNKDIVKILTYLHIQKTQYDAAIRVLQGYYNDNKEERDFDYFINMGVCHKANEDYELSLEMYDEATKINPDSHMCYTVPAEIYLKLRNFKKSMDLIDIALNKMSNTGQETFNFPNTVKLKTEVYVALNKDQENEKMLLDLLNEKFHPDVFYLLSIVNPKLIGDDLLNLAEKQLEEYDKRYTNKLDRFWYVHPLYFGLALFYNKKNQQKSENLYELGNKEIMSSLRYNSFEYQSDIVNIIDCYNKNFLNKKQIDETEGDKNFFILGTPRSGTTLIESFIASNNKVTSGGELLSARNLISDFVKNINNQSIDEFVLNFRQTYLSRTNFLRGKHESIVDKLPDNFLYIGFLFKLLPKTKIIRTFRDPWDVAVSMFKQRYVTNIPYSASFFNIGVFMANFEAINLFWDELLGNKNALLDVRYEELVENPDLHQKKIYEFLNIKSDFDEKKRKSFFSQTASIRQIGSDIHKKSLKKEEFLIHKDEFFESIHMQRKYWEKRGIISQDKDFFGYKLS